MPDKTYKSRLLDFANNTSCHGIAPLFRTRSKHWRLLWTVALIAAFTVLGYQIMTLWIKFASRPINTKVEVKHEPLPFPSVTICNSNPYRRSKIHSDDPDIEPLKKAFTALDEFEKNPVYKRVPRRRRKAVLPMPDTVGTEEASATTSSTKSTLNLQLRDVNDSLTMPFILVVTRPPDEARMDVMNVDYDLIDAVKNKTLERILREQVQLESHRVPQPGTERYGHQAIDMIQWCRFLGQDCSYRNFSIYVSRKFGNCWTFNGDELNKEAFTMKRSGTNYGLGLVINAEVYDHMPVLSSASGVRVIIHPHGTFPFPSHRGYPIPVGYQTDIGITVRKLDRLGPPYGICRNGSRFVKETGKQFDAYACKMECIHRHIKDECGCYVYYRYDDKKFLPDWGVRKCLSDEDVRCTIKLMQEYARQTFDCECPQACKETEYLTTSALTQWPSEGFTEVIRDKLCQRELELDAKGIKNYTSVCSMMQGEDHGRRFLSKNFVALSIYFKHLNYESIIQEPAYPLPSFLSDIGGTMGLYAGISLLTGIEIVALLCGLIKQTIGFCRKEQKVTKHSMSHV